MNYNNQCNANVNYNQLLAQVPDSALNELVARARYMGFSESVINEGLGIIRSIKSNSDNLKKN